jgi:hypothetical protein
MSGELHQGVVAFQPASPGRETILLGRVPVGEIGPAHDPRGSYQVCFRINLPLMSSAAWMPARDMADAQRQALGKINDWLNAADLRPNGAA